MAPKRKVESEDVVASKVEVEEVKGSNKNSTLILVNTEKAARAKNFLALVRGAKIPANQAEVEKKDTFTRALAEAGIDPKDSEALPFIYEKLGGLIRTPAEQEEAEDVAAEAKAKAGKKVETA